MVNEGDVGEDGMSKEEREKQRKRKAAERLREINKRKKMERVRFHKQLYSPSLLVSPVRRTEGITEFERR